MVDLFDIRVSLEAKIASQKGLPCHVAALIGWLGSDERELRRRIDEVVALPVQARNPEHVAALGYGASSGLLSDMECKIFRDEIAHLKGRKFFAPGRPPRFEVDGPALLGVALGTATYDDSGTQQWLINLLTLSSKEVANDDWQVGLIRAGKVCLGETGLKIAPKDLAVALAAKGLIEPTTEDLREGWTLSLSLKQHQCGPERDAVRLTAFDYVLARLGQITIGAMTRESLVQLLRSISRSMRLWTFESKQRTPKSAIARWEVENEYHVQNLLWAILAPVLSDLEDEENLPSIGYKNPRADLCVPSLRTIIEVKFMRRAGQAACANIIEEIAADASLYLSKTTDYDNIVCFVWDDCAQTEQHDELKAGLEAIPGVSAAVILPRPSKMIMPAD
ncbi:hypothetical protein [Roseibium aggregatum]|uniref:PD-(D/E)XK nuclease domain-containing protein n=1 Tax=Roseibium aggregatum TaxID=187304 RepID=UPI001A8EC1F9|nr:hypothetical protein [Roseibium aggregatum]MBN8183380.1 hypothetical protein [Roseibium aggregatum]UES46575.1 hypothetical protein GFK90_23890 [Roseibium aggregatum]